MTRAADYPPEAMDVWILAGQSNMEGCGSLEGALEPDQRVWCFNSKGEWGIARDPLHQLHHSIAPVDMELRRRGFPEDMSDEAVRAHYDAVTVGMGGGLGISFGKAMADTLERPVGLIAAAHGGTSLEDWNHSRKDEGMHSLYGAMLERVRLAGYPVAGIIWYQGEADGLVKADAETYFDRLPGWIAAVRKDLSNPVLPFVAVQIGCTTMPNPGSEEEAGWDIVRDDLYILPEHVSYAEVTSAIDLGLEDCIHIDTPGLIRLGRRAARIALGLSGVPGMSTGPRVTDVRIHNENQVRISCCRVSGGWQPTRRMSGFSVCHADGSPVPDNRVFAANRNPGTPADIMLRLNRRPKPGECISYGRGLNPYCNVVDEADMPLCAFMKAIDGTEG